MPPARPRSDAAPAALRDFLTWRLHALHKLSDAATAEAYRRECGLALGDARCLAAIGAFAPLSVKDLAQHANVDKGQASRSAQSLVEQALVSKSASADDGRGVVLTPTARGRALHRRVMALIARRNDEIFGCLDADEQARLAAMLDRLIAHAQGSEPR